MWGEIRRVKPTAWTTKGREYDSQHPVLVIGNQPFNQGPMTLVVPVMTPAREHENWWEVNLTDHRDTNTCALVTGLRTIATANLTGYVDTAGPRDMDQVLYTIRNYLDWDETWTPQGFHRGSVHQELQPRPNGQPRYCTILRYNPHNGVALTMAIGDGNAMPGTDLVSLDDYRPLHGQNLLHGIVKPSSARHRLGRFVATLSDETVNQAVEKVLKMMRPRTPRLLSPP